MFKDTNEDILSQVACVFELEAELANECDDAVVVREKLPVPLFAFVAHPFLSDIITELIQPVKTALLAERAHDACLLPFGAMAKGHPPGLGVPAVVALPARYPVPFRGTRTPDWRGPRHRADAERARRLASLRKPAPLT
jgi:hypothetical protein